jgi:oligopeptide/dipeptide ABC transporter ATP-binding protein
MNELLKITDLSVEYRRNGRKIRAVAGVDLTLAPGEILGLVGESGCGKSSLGKAIVGIEKLASGEVQFKGNVVKPLDRRGRPPELRNLQMIFQDPYGSINPRRKIGEQIADGLIVAGKPKKEAFQISAELLEKVGLGATALDRYAHQFSGGQRQRIAIARALAASPDAIIADEPISALDTSSQAQVSNLLVSLVQEFGMGVIFISHDLSVVRKISDRIAVMYLGKIVEIGTTEQIWNQASHPYTRALISAIPKADGNSSMPLDLPGDVPNPEFPPAGCRFHPRCPLVQVNCDKDVPELRRLKDGRDVACVIQTLNQDVIPLESIKGR